MIEILKTWGMQIIYLLISSFALGAFKYLLSKVKEDRKKNEENRQKDLAEHDALKLGLKSLLYSQIKKAAEDILAKGSISELELKELEADYQAYKGLGGNGFITKLYSQCMDLEVVVGKE